MQQLIQVEFRAACLGTYVVPVIFPAASDTYVWIHEFVSTQHARVVFFERRRLSPYKSWQTKNEKSIVWITHQHSCNFYKSMPTWRGRHLGASRRNRRSHNHSVVTYSQRLFD